MGDTSDVSVINDGDSTVVCLQPSIIGRQMIVQLKCGLSTSQNTTEAKLDLLSKIIMRGKGYTNTLIQLRGIQHVMFLTGRLLIPISDNTDFYSHGAQAGL